MARKKAQSQAKAPSKDLKTGADPKTVQKDDNKTENIAIKATDKKFNGKKILETNTTPHAPHKEGIMSDKHTNKSKKAAKVVKSNADETTKAKRTSRSPKIALFVAILVAGLAFLVNTETIKGTVNVKLMRVFRDLSRSKARARLHNSDSALVLTQTFSEVLLGNEEPLPIPEPDTNTPTFTVEELAFYNGVQEPLAPLYLAVRGRVYDVSAGRSFYGPHRAYHAFLGKDASRAFATGCLEARCLVPSLEGLTSAELREVDRWVELYEHHDKYTFVGVLTSQGDQVQDLVDDAMRDKTTPWDTIRVDPVLDTKELNAEGARLYALGKFTEAKAHWTAALVKLGESGGSEERGVVLLALAALAQRQGDTARALELSTEALQGLESSLTSEVADRHALLARACADVAVFHFLQENVPEAQKGLEKSLQIYSTALSTIPKDDLGGRRLVQAQLERANTRFNLARVLRSSVGQMRDAQQVLAELEADLAELPKENVQVKSLKERADKLREEVESAIVEENSKVAAEQDLRMSAPGEELHHMLY